jgi:hypothetical protein
VTDSPLSNSLLNLFLTDTIIFIGIVSIQTLFYIINNHSRVKQDIIALVIQAIGGASASLAVENEKSTKKGSHILLGGIVFQMGMRILLSSIHTLTSVLIASILLYTTLALEFLARVILRRPLKSRRARESKRSSPDSNFTASNVIGKSTNEEKEEEINEQGDIEQVQIQTISWRKVKLVVFSLGFSTLCIFIRCVKFFMKDKIWKFRFSELLFRSVYRTIELSNGFGGPIIHKQYLFSE